MKIVSFIPSRFGSTRFPGKPLALISGKPMIQHAYECATACKDVSEVYITTDDQRIFDRAQEFGGKAIMTKEQHPSGTDRIAEAAKQLHLKKNDLIVNIQGDQPIFNPSVISQMIAPLIDDKNIQMGTLKYKITSKDEITNSNIVKVVTDSNDFALYFSRSAIPFFRDSINSGTYYKHLGFYAYRLNALIEFSNMPIGNLEAAEKLEQLRALENGFKIKVVETPHDSIEVDTPEDIKKIEDSLSST